jgi:Bacterial protein YqhG of unknown function
MQQQEIHKFLERYFLANNCEILERQSSYMTIQLTIELDKELMNRPFYWHYLEKTGGVPNPMCLTLITDPDKVPENIKGETIHFGSPRLHQIFQSTKNLASYIRLYEQPTTFENKQIPLRPWIALNVKISYQCDRKKDVFKSIGLSLINGQMVQQFHDKLLKMNLTPKIPDYSFTLSPLIMPKSGVARIENYLKGEVEKESHSWAEDARKRWEKDLHLLEQFYKDDQDKVDSYQVEKQALKDQYEPKIMMSIINGGIFYLSDQAV